MIVEKRNKADIVLKILKQFTDRKIIGKIAYRAAADTQTIIANRTFSGKGLKGEFKGYSTSNYWRSASERPKGKGGKPSKTGKTIHYSGGYRQFAAMTKASAIPNLSATNSMFRAMQAKLIDNHTSRVFFTRQKEAFKALYNDASRPFFGLTAPEEGTLTKLVEKNLTKEYKRMGVL